jgi:hypothetical protein
MHMKRLSGARPGGFLVCLTGALLAAGSVRGQPSNDECVSAIEVGDGTFLGTNVAATTDGSASCGFIGSPGYNDVWWRYTAPATGTATLDTCGTVFDTILSVHDGCDGPELACNDDQPAGGCGSPSYTIQSRVDFPVIGGTAYIVRVAAFRADQRGGVGLNLSTVGPICGDGMCNGGETACTCAEDGCPPACRDGCCNGDEEAFSCPRDCEGSCGDDYCHMSESCLSCPLDCLTGCGDGCCDAEEAPFACAWDCADLADFSNFQVCFVGEDSGPFGEGCYFDFDGDGDVDLSDYNQFFERMLAEP